MSTLPQPAEIQLANQPVADDPDVILKRAEAVAKALKRFLKRKSNKVEFNGKLYPQYEDWQLVATFFSHTPKVASTAELVNQDGEIIGYLAHAQVLNKEGRVVSAAEAACMRDEANWKNKASFQLRSMAQTRACAKALRNVFAWVMVMAGLNPTPYEEMSVTVDAFTRPCYECGMDVTDTEAVETKKKYGKSLCRVCAKKEAQKRSDQVMAPIDDPQFVRKSVQRTQQVRSGQPIARVLDEPTEAIGD